MLDRELYDKRLGEIEGLNLVTIGWSGEHEDYKISGLLITDRAAVAVLAGNVEVCFVEQLTNGEYELVQCVTQLFHVGVDVGMYPQVFKDIKNLSLFEFAQKYPRFDLMGDEVGIEKGSEAVCKKLRP
ncbi:hypothetical protein [Tumebacillus permanentifrigoris]|uniref:Uncharacterized protein n=1 Tax=Tumebacillus permanentifrigoris TaxID=378543 RepID=A0A316D8Q2_9BACL|nr:hypothetical protein [Tumebacillus permanentifrigoris]PWK07029.1 hypothetical protein C7459_118103 [Tumebacillus permanentifrigoris]